jgi:anhydro-N-acetylmuramic acid kinase
VRVAGIMSGTSLDGIDVAIAEVTERRVATVAWRTAPYPSALRRRILAVSNATAATAEISRLNFELGERYAAAVLRTCRAAGIPPESLELAGCHGQTIYHESGRNTLQIGEASVVAERLGIPVVSDFRPRDIAAGGKGAPLVPWVDQWLFQDRRRTRVALNIGGIANLTAVFPDGRVTAFDTGPGNMVIDQLMQRHAGRPFDRGGRAAAAGRPHRGLLAALLRDPYYRQPPPKTAGREQYGADFVRRIEDAGLPWQDAVATATVLTASTIAIGIRLAASEAAEVIVSGGGVHNRTLLDQLRAFLPGMAVVSSAEYGVDPDAKEAIAFAVLAYRTWRGKPGNVPSATGASRAVVLGKISR